MICNSLYCLIAKFARIVVISFDRHSDYQLQQRLSLLWVQILSILILILRRKFALGLLLQSRNRRIESGKKFNFVLLRPGYEQSGGNRIRELFHTLCSIDQFRELPVLDYNWRDAP